MRIEKKILLYKNAGEIDLLDNYRGIFLRHIILSLLQKWMYSQNAQIIGFRWTNKNMCPGGIVNRETGIRSCAVDR